jgi:hypothetical protein
MRKGRDHLVEGHLCRIFAGAQVFLLLLDVAQDLASMRTGATVHRCERACCRICSLSLQTVEHHPRSLFVGNAHTCTLAHVGVTGLGMIGAEKHIAALLVDRVLALHRIRWPSVYT